MDDDFVIRSSPRWYGPNGISLRISHTERTWGVDIESLLTGQVKTLIKPSTEIKKFICRYSNGIGLTTGILFFLGAILGVFVTSAHFIESYLAKVRGLINGTANTAVIISSKLDFLIEVISTGIWPRFISALPYFL